jgi:hypothetical protein
MKPLDSEALFQAIQEVLAEEFEEEVESLILDGPLSSPAASANSTDSLFQRFGEWLESNLRATGNLSCLSPLGRRDCKRVLQKLGGSATSTTPVAEILLSLSRQLGIPPLEVAGRAHYLSQCSHLLAEANAGKPNEDRLATTGRQLVERVLRETSLLFAHTDAGDLLVEALAKDDKIALPDLAASQPPDRSAVSLEWLRQQLLVQDWGDLGFLALLLRRGSKAIQRRREKGPSLSVDVEILKQEEADAFLGLARALQPYVHFKPAHASERFAALKSAIEHASRGLTEMADRDVLPRALIAIEKITGLFGQSYFCRNDAGYLVRIRCDENLPLGKRILYRISRNPTLRVVGWVQTPWR